MTGFQEIINCVLRYYPNKEKFFIHFGQFFKYFQNSRYIKEENHAKYFIIRYFEYSCLKILQKLFKLNFLEAFLYHYLQN